MALSPLLGFQIGKNKQEISGAIHDDKITY